MQERGLVPEYIPPSGETAVMYGSGQKFPVHMEPGTIEQMEQRDRIMTKQRLAEVREALGRLGK